MSPYDAVFLALVASRCLNRPKHWWLLLLVPFLTYGLVSFDFLGHYASPLVAVLVTLLFPSWAPVALLLALPAYGTVLQCLGAAVTWLGLDWILEVLLARVNEDAIPPRLRGWPMRLLIVAILYYTLLPIAWL